MTDCPYTGKTLVEKRELPPLPPALDTAEIPGASHKEVGQTEELSGENQPFRPETQSDQSRAKTKRQLCCSVI